MWNNMKTFLKNFCIESEEWKKEDSTLIVERATTVTT